MNAAAGLVTYSAAVLAFGPSVLGRLSRAGHAPRVGVAAWVGAVASVLMAWLAAAILLVISVAAHWGRHNSLVRCCVEVLCRWAAGDAGRYAQLGVLTGVGVVLAGIGYLVVRGGRTVVRLRGRARAHAQAVRLVGHPTDVPDVYVVDAPERTAYCVAGRPSTIVVTSAAVAVLDRHELAAVIAHERAHVAGHHPAVMTMLRGVATVFARVRLMNRAVTEVSRLLEMCADDAAARRHGRCALVGGLMALVAAVPAGALGAADVAVLSRAQRLLSPATPGGRVSAQIGLTAAATAFLLTPASLVVLDIAGLLPCI
ncbi:peptidase M48 [Mycobacterium sp. 852013-50091_SCH5140682]|uniref:M56 family metallopeptidase n=1 Tax=Mycobacterium sp. 852013-50091_SCH5140682 TaxID=1834109 RepID=UPI0007EA1953|nr:M56 family metallopeptidase [Mycobacterium sp. 852013-50091_SCH5140682]OBC17478.1 peptidase M48 [Mycobacterium sp. 852013-50091_SCH5140682]